MKVATNCPECGERNARAISSGLGGRWKILCRACGYRYDEGCEDEGQLPVDPVLILNEERE